VVEKVPAVNTKRMALLAAIGTGLNPLASFLPMMVLLKPPESISSFFESAIGIVLILPLWILPWALPVFYFLVYRSEALLLIPASLKRAALAVAIATGLQAIWVIDDRIRGLISAWDFWRNDPQRVTHEFAWLWWHIVVPPISLFAAAVVPLFFAALYRSPQGEQPVSRRVKKAAMFAAVAAGLGAALLVWGRVSTGIVFSRYQAHSTVVTLSQLARFRFWVLDPSISVIAGASLVVFFVLLCRRLPTDQSSQSVRMGE
jgi:hypothetical protein